MEYFQITSMERGEERERKNKKETIKPKSHRSTQITLKSRRVSMPEKSKRSKATE
jgi:hypothetical protein